MQKRLGFLCFAAVLVCFLGSIFLFPIADNGDDLATLRHQAEQALKEVKSSNAYQTNSFRRLRENEEMAAALRFWVMARNSGRTEDASYRQARQDFQQFLPQLLQDIERPIYLAEDPMDSQASLVSLALCAQAKSLVEQGDTTQALEIWDATIRFGKTVASGRSLSALQRGVEIENQALDSFVEAWSPRGALQADFEPAALIFTRGILPNALFAETLILEREALLDKTSSIWRHLDLGLLGSLPGSEAREKRILTNLLYALVRRIQSAQEPLPAPQPTLAGLLQGKVGLTTGIATSGVFILQETHEKTRRRQWGLAMALALLNHHAGKGTWPEQLAESELPESLSPLLDFEFANSCRLIRSDGRVTLRVPYPRYQLQENLEARPVVKDDWVVDSGKAYEFILSRDE